MYKLIFTKPFDRDLRKFCKNREQLINRIEKVLDILQADPFHEILRTHKVNSKNHGTAFSSRINGDLRIIWNFSQDKIQIFLLDIGGHSGKDKVYS
ncbi:MAG: plasmid stabilization protein [Candidatus Melainabacteria bacterium]|jgi:mRNA-degrading endonuclease YafQ of YafQ-DinJ toxin-antitoxin module|nr:plasmid stabilization protein [Candidatus Melainabacteria bacterium]